MTPSRRSSAASQHRSSLTISRKSSLVPSVSFVHAEPEQSSPPSGSAAAKLSPRVSLQSLQIRDKDMGKSLAPNKSESMLGKLVNIDVDEGVDAITEAQPLNTGDEFGPKISRESTEESAKGSLVRNKPWFTFRRTPSKQSLTVPESAQSASTSTTPPPSESPKSIAVHPENSSEVQVDLPPAVPIPIKSQSSSPRNEISPAPSPGWFGSFSKAQRAVPQGSPNSNEAVKSQSHEQGPCDGRISCADTRSSEVQLTSGNSIWFAPKSPSRSQLDNAPSIPCSLDVKTTIEKERPPSPKPLPELELISSHKSDAKLSTLNPTTSRFTLSMPLLGRPKLPLDMIATRTSSEEVIMPLSTVSGPDNTAPPESLAFPDVSISEGSTVTNRCELEVKRSSSSWWDYIGLGGGGGNTEAPSSPLSQAPPHQDSTLVDVGSMEATAPLVSLAEEQHVVEGAGVNTESSPISNTKGVEDRVTVGSSASVTSGPSAASAWYSPWGWYEWYNAPTIIKTPKASTSSKSNAEFIKEEALARPDPPGLSSTSTSVQESDTATSSPGTISEPINPIISSLTTNSRGWASFFSSRSLATKLITEKGDTNEGRMEVMDMDDDANEVNFTSVPTSSQIHTGSGAVVDVSNADGKVIAKKISSRKETNNEPVMPKATTDILATTSESGKRKAVNPQPNKRSASPTPSKKSAKSIVSPTPRPPNHVLPAFNDTFDTLPRSRPPPQAKSTTSLVFKKTMGFVNNVLFAREQSETADRGRDRFRRAELEDFGKELPRTWEVLGEVPGLHPLSTCKSIVIIGVHGWFPGYAMRTVIGEPTGTSAKFANMMESAVKDFAEKRGIEFEKITKIPLEGEGKIEHRVQNLYRNLTGNDSWIKALHDADVIFIATHSQGSIVSTHLISRLITDGHIRTSHSKSDATTAVGTNIISGSGYTASSPFLGRRPQRVCCLALCGIHLGPLAYLQKNSFVMPYIQYFESEAAVELFEFQHTESRVSKEYVEAIRHVLDHGVKFVYIASMNDQVVPVYSGAFTSVTHPLILRALYIDGDAYHSSDFLSNLLVLLIRIRNAGLSDGGLLAHLSEATAGSLNGVGHSTAYEELATFSLAVKYLFLVNDGCGGPHELVFEPFNARNALNDYEASILHLPLSSLELIISIQIPWALRDLVADERVIYLFSKEFAELRDAFDGWHPRTTILRDLKRKLEPIRRLKLASSRL